MVKLTAAYPSYTDEFGEHEAVTREFEPQMGLWDYCFAVVERPFRCIVKEFRVSGYWFTNIWGYRMTNDWCFTADDYGTKLFKADDLQKAIELCEKKNRMRKVKVVRMC